MEGATVFPIILPSLWAGQRQVTLAEWAVDVYVNSSKNRQLNKPAKTHRTVRGLIKHHRDYKTHIRILMEHEGSCGVQWVKHLACEGIRQFPQNIIFICVIKAIDLGKPHSHVFFWTDLTRFLQVFPLCCQNANVFFICLCFLNRHWFRFEQTLVN